ncbi:MAG: NAD(P)/FAD-dependent oxidoreductase [Anaerolineae bacterium]|nr:NAD(P)/FAD-dependent oxidoreductase [Thermoflexales bacterium]MDW8407891.1 NAD(P)/FAD-dependent oxidoreductase [Anaerolineae bacterium]
MQIAIIGAGATGLAAAHELLKAGHTLTVFEATERPGGLAGGFKAPGWDWSLEKFYHHWFASDADLLRLAEEIGVRQRVIYNRPQTVVYYQERFYPLDGALSTVLGGRTWADRLPLSGSLARGLLALRYPGFNVIDVLRYGLAGAYLVLTSDWRRLEQFTAHEWLSRWMGRRVYGLLFRPLLQGKFAEYAEQVNMAWMWARIKARTPMLGTYIGGFQAFFDDLAAHLQRRGATIVYGARVESIVSEHITGHLRLTVHPAAPDRQPAGLANPQSFDRVLVTTSPRLMTKLAPQLPADYLGALNHLKSLGAVVLIVALNRQLSRAGYYWHNLPKSAGFPFLALCEHTNFVSAQHFGGQHLVYCGDYLPVDHPYFAMNEADLRAAFLPALRRINPDFDESWVQHTWVFKEPYAQPVPFVNHSRAIPPVRTPWPGLFFASMSQVYPWDRGTNYAVKLGREAAAQMVAGL